VAAPIAVLRCPSSRDAAPPGEPAWADYGAIDVNPFLADIGMVDPADKFEGALPVNGQVKLGDLTDGAAQTLLVVEAPGANAWASPSTLAPARYFPPAEGRHRGGANVSFADGSVRLMRRDTPLRTVAKLVTRAGGEAIAADEY
jgi:prepilin-type processing-associated H-X9-DG protein